MDPNNRPAQSTGGLVTLGTSVTGSGCLTAILLIGAIFLGRQLDAWFGTAPWILLALIFTSIPLSLFMMVHSALSAARTAQEQYERRQRERDAGEFSDRAR
ncbi:MAG TPA: AtpZ/AtpI family protein [Aggregatilineales bacterium]|nr:AtpZ/AtpI family protein [Aggregatilineales bacterium]